MKRFFDALLICAILLLVPAGCTSRVPQAASPSQSPLQEDPGGYLALFRERYDIAQAVADHYTAAGCGGKENAVTDEKGTVWYPCVHYSSITELRAATRAVFSEERAQGFFSVAFSGSEPAYRQQDGTLLQNPGVLFDASPWLGEDLFEDLGIEFLLLDTLMVKQSGEDFVSYTVDCQFTYPGDPVNVGFLLVRGEDGIWRFDTCFEETAPAEAEDLALQYLRENNQEARVIRMWLIGRYNDITDTAVEVYGLDCQVQVMNQGELDWLSPCFGGDLSCAVFSLRDGEYSLLTVKGLSEGDEPRDAAVEAVYGLADLEFSLCRDFSRAFWGIGGHTINLLSEDFLDERLDYDVYYEGDYWFCRSYPGLSLLCYYSSESGLPSIYSIDLTRDDFTTCRGIRVGSSREDVQNAYPEIRPEHFPADEWGDQLVYESMPGAICGYFLHFYFENDQVVRIMMENMFD
mgnify:CR=1 FL=1